MSSEAGGGLYPDILDDFRARIFAGNYDDAPALLDAVEATLKAARRLDQGWGDYGHLVNRHETASMFREAITSALTASSPGQQPGTEEGL